MHSPEVQAAFDRLKRLRRNHSPRVVYSSEAEKSLLSYAEVNSRVREDERVVLEWYLAQVERDILGDIRQLIHEIELRLCNDELAAMYRDVGGEG